MPQTLIEYLLPGTECLVAACPSGYFLIQGLAGEGFSFWHFTILINRADKFRITGKQELPSLNYTLKNAFSLLKRNCTAPVIFSEGQYNIGLLFDGEITAEFETGGPVSFLSISYSPQYLSNLSRAYPQFGCYLHESTEKQGLFLNSESQSITQEMRGIISHLLHDDCKDEFANLSIKKGRTLELLLKIAECPTQTSYCSPIAINKLDLEKIDAAKSWLDQVPNRSITLFEISRKVGLNVHKLSTGFLQLTGATVFNYHRKIRMSKAVQLLEETDWSIFDIGTEIGYTDGKTFSKEFKKVIGISPVGYRKQTRIRGGKSSFCLPQC